MQTALSSEILLHIEQNTWRHISDKRIINITFVRKISPLYTINGEVILRNLLRIEFSSEEGANSFLRNIYKVTRYDVT
jgi:hypothetical protein